MAKRWIDWMFRSRVTGQITIGQLPNIPLVAFAACRIAEAVSPSESSASDVLHWAGTAALAWWALDEVIRGVNPFRRALGATALTYLIVTL